MMSSLSMVEAKLPAGFRFHPRDEELVCDYLMKKVTASDQPPLMIEVDLNKCEPWDLPETTRVGGKEWYFYSQRDRKYSTGLRTNRATISGYWKATGKDRPVTRKATLVGMRKTLVFYQGRAPKGRKSDWVMHEFRLEGPLGPPKLSSSKDDWVLCRVFHKKKEVAAKQVTGSVYDNEMMRSRSSLPPLMEPYNITFDQTQNNLMINQYHHGHDEQVPCFSIFTPNQTSPTFSQVTHINQPNYLSTTSTRLSFPTNWEMQGGLPDNIGMTYSISSSTDKQVLKAIVDHLNTKMESVDPNMKQSPSFGEGSSESFLSEEAVPTMWNNQY